MTQAAMDDDTMVAVTPEDKQLTAEILGCSDWGDATDYRNSGEHDRNRDRILALVSRHRHQSGRTGAGEVVALLHENVADGEVQLELYRHGAGCLTDADKAAGWTETPLYAAISQSTAGEELPRWVYDIQWGPEGQQDYAHVYDLGGNLIAVMKTHDAARVAKHRGGDQ